MGEQEINHFLTYLAVNKKVSASTQNQALCSILFLYKQVIKKSIGWINKLEWAKKPKTIPIVLSPGKVKVVAATSRSRLDSGEFIIWFWLASYGVSKDESERHRF